MRLSLSWRLCPLNSPARLPHRSDDRQPPCLLGVFTAFATLCLPVAGDWLAANHGGGDHKGWYAERMWIPCVMLDAAAVSEALTAGRTFRQRVLCNEVPQWPWLARLLYLRFRIPGLRRVTLDRLGALRREHGGRKPHYIYCDTGADLHDYLVRKRGLAFADLGAAWWPTAVAHYHGVTRRALRPWMRNAADVGASRVEATTRVAKIYGVKLPGN